MKRILLLPSAAALAACCSSIALADPPVDIGGPPEIIIHRINPQYAIRATPPSGSSAPITPLITNHGGGVIGTPNVPNVYLIWYGNWNQSNGTDTSGGQQIVRDFLTAVGNSPYFAINTTYPGVVGNVNFTSGANETTDLYSQGSRLSDSKITSIVSRALPAFNGGVPDLNGVYFVLTSSDVAENSGFCTRYCGWHTHSTISGKDIKYSFVGNAARCLNACAIQSSGPNGNAGVDGMVSVIAHELEEATTDPDLNAWYDSGGAENADKCAWTFGIYTTDANGVSSNMTIGSRRFMIQRNLYRTPDGTLNYCQTWNSSSPSDGQNYSLAP